MANVCPGGPPVPNEPVTTQGITTTPNVPQPIYSTNATDPFPVVKWNPTDEFCSFQFTVTPGNQLVVPVTSWNVNWINPDLSVSNDAGANPAIAAGFGVPQSAQTPVTGPATSGPIVIGTNTVTITIVSGTVRVSMGNGSLFGYNPGDPVSNAVIKYQWANPITGLQHVYFDNGTDQTPKGITNYQTSASVVAPLTNLQCGVGALPLDIQDTQANLRGSGDNVPLANTLSIRVSLTPGGPYTAWIGPLTPGTNTVGQTIQNIFGCTTSPPKFLPSTQYYYRIEERDAGLALINASSECTFTTLAASNYMDCGPNPNLQTRNWVFSALVDGLVAPCDGSLVTFEHSTSNAGPWTLSDDLDFNAVGPCTLAASNPRPFNGASTSVAAWVNSNGLVHNTNYFVRYTLQKSNGDPNEVVICGPFKTNDYPVWSCNPPANITSTSGDVSHSFAPVGAGGGTPGINNQAGCDDDSYILRWGTTLGGPYPNAEPVRLASAGANPGTWSLTGLTPGVPIYYVLEASEMQETGGIYQTTPECTFTPTAVPPTETAQCGPATNIDSNSASLNGTLGNIAAGDQYRIRYGIAPGGPYGTTLGPFPAANGAVSQPTGNVLAPSTTYYFVVDVLTAGNILITTSGECTFNTQAAQNNVTDPASAITTTSAILNGRAFSTEPGDTMEFIWGTTPGGPYPNTACPGQPTTQPTNPDLASCPLGGLLPNTNYCYRLVTRNALNVVTATGNQQCFMTAANPPPTIQTDPPTAITSTCITFNGGGLFVPAGCAYAFEYGTSPGGPYPFTTNDGVSTGASPENFSAQQCGLTPGTQYYYRALINCGGNKTFGPEVPALTTNILVDPCEPATAITPTSATLHATSQNVPAGYTYQFRYGTTPGGPYPFTVSGGPSSGGTPDPYQANAVGLTPGTTYYYTAEVLNPAQQVVAGGGECSFATTGAIGPGGFVYWCGQLYDSANCTFVPSNGGGYFDCNQA